MTMPAYILAGGRSRRFGSDKARAEIDGAPMIQRIAASLAPFASSLTVVADHAGKYADLDLRTIADAGEAHRGPVNGLRTALHDASGDGGEARMVLLVSCDMPTLRVTWLEALRKASEAGHGAAFRDRFWQPFPLVLSTDARAKIEALMQRAESPSMQRALEACEVCAVAMPEDWPGSFQVNAPDDLRRVQAGLR